MTRLAVLATALFPVWALAASAWALWQPELFQPARGAIVPLLALVMFAMGLTLTPADFARAWRRPRTVALGLALQYTVMPVAALAAARLLHLPEAALVGMVLVGASPGGTASNVVCYLARGDVALSITLTLASTLLAVAALPALSWLLLGHVVPVPALAMLESVARIVVVPVAAGVILNAAAGRWLAPAAPVFPLLAVAAIVFIIAVIVALNQARLQTLGPAVVAAVALHNAAGLAAGWVGGRLAGLDPAGRRTLAIEVGMQNSGLAVALAVKHFSTAAALPGAVFSIWHNLTGSALAAWWSRRPRHGAAGQSRERPDGPE